MDAAAVVNARAGDVIALSAGRVEVADPVVQGAVAHADPNAVATATDAAEALLQTAVALAALVSMLLPKPACVGIPISLSVCSAATWLLSPVWKKFVPSSLLIAPEALLSTRSSAVSSHKQSSTELEVMSRTIWNATSTLIIFFMTRIEMWPCRRATRAPCAKPCT